MSYPTLRKLYYQNEHIWKEEYQKRFSAFSTLHFDFKIKEYNHKTDYPIFLCYTPEIVQLLNELHNLNLKLLFSFPMLPPAALEQYTQSCMIEEIQASNEIEGVRSSRKEIQDAIAQLNSLSKEKPLRFHSIVEKYNKLNRREKINFNTSEDIRTFYDNFIKNEVISENKKNTPDGKIFRADNVDITTGTQKILHRGVFPEDNLIKAMDKALILLNNKDYPLFIRLAIFHYLFGYIHPFYDGNGRTIRFITSYYIAVDFSPLIAFNLSLFIKRNKKIYYQIFEETNSYLNCGDLGFFVTEFLKIIKQSMEETYNYLNTRAAQYIFYTQKIKELKIKDELIYEIYHVLLQASLFTISGATMQDIINAINKSRNTIIKRMEAIPENHILKTVSEKPFRFKLNLEAFK